MASAADKDVAAKMASRPTYTTKKYRAEDLVVGDVTRNRFGKWDTVTDISLTVRFATISFFQSELVVYRVHLCDVQVVKPS